MNNSDTHSDLHREGTSETAPVSHESVEDAKETLSRSGQRVVESRASRASSRGHDENTRLRKSNREKNFVRVFLEISTKYIVLLVVLFVTAFASFFVFFQPTKSVSIPNVVGKDFIDASILLQERDLYVKVAQQFTSDPSDIGKVINQSPRAGVFVRAKRSVLVTVSKGTVVSEVPDLMGVSLQRADDIIYGQFSGFYKLFEINSINKIFSEEDPGSIVAQSPLPGTKINNAGTKIDLVVSRGMVDNHELMIDIEGLYFDEIFDYLSDLGVEFEFYISELFGPSSIEKRQNSFPSGIILEQAPIANTPFTEETILRIGVRGSTVKKEAVTPNASTPTTHNDTIQMLSIPVNNVTGPIIIRKTVGSESADILQIHAHSNTVTVPYKATPNEVYEAITANEGTFWKYNVTQEDSE